MSTRATIRFAKREEGVSFNEHPHQWNAQFYRHHDGYPEGLGVEIAESFTKYGKLLNWEVESLDVVHSDIEYLYYVWQCHGKSEPWISIFEIKPLGFNEYGGDCIFVGTPDMLLKRYDERHAEPTRDRCECEYESECNYGRGLCGAGCIKNTI